MLFCLGFSIAPAATPDETGSTDFRAPLESLTQKCGQSVDDMLKAARAALARHDADDERAALVCLTEAVSRLNSARLDAVRDVDHAHVLAVPQYGAKAP